MATSGTTNFSLNARSIVTYALRKLRVVGAGSPVMAEDMETGIEELNVLLKEWAMRGPSVWRASEGSLTLTANTASFNLPSVLRLSSARLRQSGRDIPMSLLTRDEYFDLPLKTTTGTPTQYHFAPSRASGTLYIWPLLAAAAGETIEYTYQRRIEDVADEDNDLDIPQEHLALIGYGLAQRLKVDFGKGGELARMIDGEAERLRMEAMTHDREDVYRFEPDRT